MLESPLRIPLVICRQDVQREIGTWGPYHDFVMILPTQKITIGHALYYMDIVRQIYFAKFILGHIFQLYMLIHDIKWGKNAGIKRSVCFYHFWGTQMWV